MDKGEKLITVAIHTYEKALILKTLLEKEGISVVINNVNLIQPVIASGVRVRIHERDLPLALKIIETSSIHGEESEETKSERKIVLIPIDFSDYSKKACSIGFDFAREKGCEVLLLHSYLTATGGGIAPFAMDEYEYDEATVDENKLVCKISKDKMREFEKRLREYIKGGKLPNVKFTSVVTEGVPETAILESAKSHDTALIVMGTRGKSKKEADLIGSVSAEVLDAGKYPVFTVPEAMSINAIDEIKNVVFFSNISQQDLISFDDFARLFKHNNLKVTIVPISDHKDKDDLTNYLDALMKYCKGQYPKFEFSSKCIGDEDFLEEFNAFVKEKGIDLIMVPNKKRNIFARLFNPSMAHRMLFHSDVPMMVVPI